MTVMSAFDLVADRFECHRALPGHVPVAIRRALHEHGAIGTAARLLEVGCGTGRIGAQFAAERDNYFGVDLSMAMLREFHRKNVARTPALVQADGCFLPFDDQVFDAVLMVHLLTVRNWRALLAEAHRVLQRGGVLGIGKTQGPPEGLDATMRNRLDELVAGMGITEPIPDRGGMGEWLRARSSRYIEITPAHWTVDRTPREFFLRKQSAARFASLPADVREAALRLLAEWTEHNIGPLDTSLSEPHDFRLELYWLQGGSRNG
jgi:ubiquinone/menaquinone biosynthesis C-methylase UbiE